MGTSVKEGDKLLFSLSLKRLKDGHLTSVAIKPSMLKNPEEHSLVNNDSRQNESANVIYLIHPFLREVMRTRYWNEGKRQMYEKAYYKTYTDQVFVLANTALQKDGYVDCLEEFGMEQQKFSNEMKEIGTGPVCENLSSHRRDVFKDVLNNRSTPDYIATLLFCGDITHPSLLLDFYKGC